MIISDRKGFICFRPPKTGGSSIISALREYADYQKFLQNIIAFNNSEYSAHYLQHTTFKQALHDFTLEKIKTFFCFCFVRNPYDRFYSAFEQHMQALSRRYTVTNLVHVDFNRYVAVNINRYVIENVFIFAEFLPCRLYTHYEGRLMMDYIGYVERLASDLQVVCDTLKLGDVDLRNKNVRTRPKPECDPGHMKSGDYKYLDKYTRTSIEIVNECYAKDFEYYGYQMLDPKDFPQKISGHGSQQPSA